MSHKPIHLKELLPGLEKSSEESAGEQTLVFSVPPTLLKEDGGYTLGEGYTKTTLVKVTSTAKQSLSQLLELPYSIQVRLVCALVRAVPKMGQRRTILSVDGKRTATVTRLATDCSVDGLVHAHICLGR